MAVFLVCKDGRKSGALQRCGRRGNGRELVAGADCSVFPRTRRELERCNLSAGFV
jgi:hypothetical protein